MSPLIGYNKPMELIVEHTKLYEILQEFHKITGLKVSFIENYDRPVLGVPATNCALCDYKQQNREFYLKCRECDTNAMQCASKSKDTYIYECHYHLIEALHPVDMYGQRIGYFLLGQMLIDEEKFIRLSRPTEYELSLLKQMASPTLEMLHSASKILAWLAEYTVLNRHLDLTMKQTAEPIARYIEANFSQKLTVDGLCELFHFSRPTLFARFKKEYGMGVTEYVNNTRIEKGKKLLERYDVSETAERVGFSDANYFSRIFKKYTGLSPSDYARLTRRQKSDKPNGADGNEP